jgi:cell surface protein SprA
MPLNSSLIRGAKFVWGKTQLQFGKTTVTGVFQSKNHRQKRSVTRWRYNQDFDMFALDYDSDTFLSQYFRKNMILHYYPFIDSRVQISRLEIWVTNKQTRVNTNSNNLRNIIALQDLGEGQLSGIADNEVVVLDPSTGIFNSPLDTPSDNANNDYDPAQIGTGTGLLNNNIREIATSAQDLMFQ